MAPRLCYGRLPLWKEAVLTPSENWGFLAVALLGVLGCVWMVLYSPRLYHGAVLSTDWPPTIRWLSRIGWIIEALALVGFGVIVMQYPTVAVPANAPPIDHVIKVLALVCYVGGFVVLVAWRVALSAYERRVRRQEANHR